MGTPEDFPIAGSIDVHEPLTTKSYEELLNSAKALGAEIGVPYDMYDATFRLLDELHDFDEATVGECLQDLPFALATADVLIRFYDQPEVDRGYVWAASLLADIGKQFVPKELIQDSHRGVIWTPNRFEAMKPHAVAGAYHALRNGLPFPVVRAIAEHHGMQDEEAQCYGESPILVGFERTTRDCVTTADYHEAMMGRNNSRNTHLNHDARLAKSYAHVRKVFRDYYRSAELADAVFEQLLATVV